MVALRLIRLIETHCDDVSRNLATRIRSSVRTAEMQKVSEPELIAGLQELLQHLSEWLLTKTESDIEKRYNEMGARRALLGIPLSDSCWAVVMTKEYLWDFLQKQGFLRNPIELYGEMELLSLLDQFFDRAICFMVQGYEQGRHSARPEQVRKKHREFNAAAFVP
ncbi:MAG TPA: hypothetical protein VJO35_06345 [Terriglobales bacterium]|nr:hypothetical protein [Terriglobales bacterium]